MGNIKVKSDIRALTRKNNCINFWFIVKNSMNLSERQRIYREPHLINACVFGVVTVEAMLNDLSEDYLPDEIFNCIEKEMKTKEKIKMTIKHLTGQIGLYNATVNDVHSINVIKVELGRFFQEKEWLKFIELLKIRNKIIHNRTESRVWGILDNNKGGVVKDVRSEWDYDIEDIPELID